ncbi:translation initiation factor IF-2-like [Serinus canaria]|uniref:translation initiation factor IF-2-like n=1 Tax=Serinus canaria TaxID=9135 RepID=UPI0021CCDC4C|nr:translation initiation factor IF-2-like [Serinus canaria]
MATEREGAREPFPPRAPPPAVTPRDGGGPARARAPAPPEPRGASRGRRGFGAALRPSRSTGPGPTGRPPHPPVGGGVVPAPAARSGGSSTASSCGRGVCADVTAAPRAARAGSPGFVPPGAPRLPSNPGRAPCVAGWLSPQGVGGTGTVLAHGWLRDCSASSRAPEPHPAPGARHMLGVKTRGPEEDGGPGMAAGPWENPRRWRMGAQRLCRRRTVPLEASPLERQAGISDSTTQTLLRTC